MRKLVYTKPTVRVEHIAITQRYLETATGSGLLPEEYEYEEEW